MTFDGLLPIALGGSLAIAGGIIGQWSSKYFDGKRQRRVVAGAFAGEVGAICAIVERRRYIDLLKSLQLLIRQGHLLPISLPVTQDYITIFKANAGSIGALPPALALDTVRFYTQVKAMLEDVRTDGPKLETQEQADWHVTQIIQMLEDTMALGCELTQRLRKVAK